MAQITIRKSREFDYDNKYDIDIRTTQTLSKEDYKTIVDSIESISGVLDPHINTLRMVKKQ